MGHTPRWLRKQREAQVWRDRWAPFYESNLETYKREIQRWANWSGREVPE